MPDTFSPLEFVVYLRRKWRFFAVACFVAVAGASVISLLLTKQYTARTRLIIEPPAGSDPRAATAVSPVYLDSLRSYEHFASSDSLFQRALDHFGLRRANPGRSIESWKRAVLKVEIPRNTKILEISATLPDRKTAHEFSLYVAKEALALNRSVSREGDSDMISGLEEQLQAAKSRLDAAQQEWNRLSAQEPVQAMSAEIQAEHQQRARVQEQLLPAEMTIAEDADREKLLSSGQAGASGAELETVRSELRFAQVRARMLREQVDRLDRSIEAKQAILAARMARADQATVALKAARDEYEALNGRIRDVKTTFGYRGERLEIMDPGIVPERPSYPNIPLNVSAALLLALAGCFVYITLEFGWRQRERPARPALRVAAKGHEG